MHGHTSFEIFIIENMTVYQYDMKDINARWPRFSCLKWVKNCKRYIKKNQIKCIALNFNTKSMALNSG